MQGMEPYESIAILLGGISTYAFFLTSVGEEIFRGLGLMRGFAVIGILCLTSAAWLIIMEAVRGLHRKVRK